MHKSKIVIALLLYNYTYIIVYVLLYTRLSKMFDTQRNGQTSCTKMSEPFLHKYRSSIRFKTFLGLCRVRVIAEPNYLPRNLRVVGQASIITTLDVALLFVILFIYPYCAYFAFFSRSYYSLSYTFNLALRFQQFTMILAFPVILLLSIFNRHRHARLLNNIAAVYDRVVELTCFQPRYTRHLRCIHTLNCIDAGILSVCMLFGSVADVYFSPDDKSALDDTFLCIYAVGQLTLRTAMLHVRDLLLVLTDVQRVCEANMSAEDDEDVSGCDEDLLDVGVALLDEVRYCIVEVADCFSGLLIVWTCKEFIVLATGLFLIVAEFELLNAYQLWNMIIILASYVMPVILNMVLIVSAFERAERFVNTTQRMIVRQECNNSCVRSGLVAVEAWNGSGAVVLHAVLHWTENQCLMAHRFFPINHSMLFSVNVGKCMNNIYN